MKTKIGIIIGALMWISGSFITNQDVSFYLGAFGLLFIFGSLYLKAKKEGN